MTKLLLALALLAPVTMTSIASADILRPPTVKTRNVTGKKAKQLYDAMNVATLR